MNRLQLCQRLAREAGIAQPTTTISQSGELLRVVEWIDNAWNSIQLAKRWGWQWENPTITINVAAYTATGSIPESRYDENSAFTAAGAELTFMPWQDFKLVYPVLTITDGLPQCWTVRPDMAVAVNAKPTGSNFQFSVERWKMPTAMAADGDTPTLPDVYHMAIVWRALRDGVASYDEAGAQWKLADANYRDLMSALESWDQPRMRMGGPLA